MADKNPDSWYNLCIASNKVFIMITIGSSSKIRESLLLLTVVMVVLSTSAAAADIHLDLAFHDDCVLCQLAQLDLTVPTTGIDLPPPVAVISVLPQKAIAWNYAHVISPFSIRGPPA